MSTNKNILNFIIREKSLGNSFQELNIQMRIMMKGVNVKGILDGTVPDTYDITEKLKEIAAEFQVDLGKMKG